VREGERQRGDERGHHHADRRRQPPTHCRFIAFTPQWAFLDFVAEQATRWPGFTTMM
jgi:hypothetical protein